MRQVLGQVAADRTALLLCFFPSAFVLSMPYSEGLFLTAAALCIYFLARRAWLASGVMASLATLARDPGIVLVLICFVAAAREIAARRSWRPVLALVSAPLGLAAWTLYQWLRLGNPFAFLQAETYWGQGPNGLLWPLRSLLRLAIRPAAWAQPFEVAGAAAGVFAILGVGLMVRRQVARRDLPLSWWLFTAGTVGVAFANSLGGSIPRFVMVAFPLLAVVAVSLPRRAETAVIAASAMLQAVLAVAVFASVAMPQSALFAP